MDRFEDLPLIDDEVFPQQGQLYGRLEFAAPWGFRFPGEKGICLMVTRGSCFLGVDEEEPLVPLVGGDFIFLSSPLSYSLRSSLELSVRPIEAVTSEDEFRHVICRLGADDPQAA